MLAAQEESRVVLNYILHLLTLVVAKKDFNKMDAENCATVFSPTLFVRPQGASLLRTLHVLPLLSFARRSCSLVVASANSSENASWTLQVPEHIVCPA
jgi:hypothetical protein